ncbi:MAG: hypothetical protein JKY70_20715 [Mucilaginibacter sp.]|nr:hypothetical protein [Mucilaginibacter sp.]
MYRKAYFKLVLVLAAILFIAKPFIGFVLHARLSAIDEHPTILVKSSTKYRFESLNDTEFCKDASGELFPTPVIPFFMGIGALLSLLFSRFAAGNAFKAGDVFAKKLFVPSQPVYLTTLRLSI